MMSTESVPGTLIDMLLRSKYDMEYSFNTSFICSVKCLVFNIERGIGTCERLDLCDFDQSGNAH